MRKNWMFRGIGLFTSLVASVCIIILGVNFLSFYFEGWFSNPGFQAPANAGELGDSFGTSNALFSALTLVVVIYAALKQREELKITQIALDEQSKQAKISQFEQTLFRMIENFQNLTHDIDLDLATVKKSSSGGASREPPKPQRTRTGPDALKVLLKKLERKLKDAKLVEDVDRDKRIALFIEIYRDFWQEAEWELSHYFRTIYNIYSYIDKIAEIDHSAYIRIVRANHSKAELALLFYNALTEDGRNFRKLIQKYDILKHLGAEKGEYTKFLSFALDESNLPPAVSGGAKNLS